MNKTLIQFVTFFEIVFLAVPPGAWAGVVTSSDPNANTAACPGLDSCTTQCQTYQSQLQTALNTSCPAPTPGASFTSINVGSNSYSTLNDCQLAIKAQWGVLGQKCDARDFYMEATTMDLITSTLYTAAAAICVAACAAEATPAGPYLQGICTGADLGASAFDMIETIQLETDKKGQMEWWQYVTSNTAMGTAGLGGAASGAGLASKLIKKNKAPTQDFTSLDNVSDTGSGTSTNLSKNASKYAKTANNGDALLEPSETIMEEDPPTKDITKNAGKTGGSKTASKILACAAAGLLVATAALKWANYGVNCTNAQKECKDAANMANPQPGSIIGLTNYSASPGPINNYSLNNNNPNSSNGGNGASGAGSSGIQSLFDNLPSSPSQMMAQAASASPGLTSLNQSLPNVGSGLTSGLGQLGTSLPALASSLASGTSPASAIGGAVSGLPSDLKAAIDHVQQLANDGKIGFKDMPSSVMISGGGGGFKSGSSTSLGTSSLLGSLGAAKAGATAAETKFDPKKPTELTLSSDGDIWHASWNGTIFQLVSAKLSQSKSKIEELEWSTPLNRALMGLKPEPTKGKIK